MLLELIVTQVRLRPKHRCTEHQLVTPSGGIKSAWQQDPNGQHDQGPNGESNHRCPSSPAITILRRHTHLPDPPNYTDVP